jgi:hypothetical protein
VWGRTKWIKTNEIVFDFFPLWFLKFSERPTTYFGCAMQLLAFLRFYYKFTYVDNNDILCLCRDPKWHHIVKNRGRNSLMFDLFCSSRARKVMANSTQYAKIVIPDRYCPRSEKFTQPKSIIVWHWTFRISSSRCFGDVQDSTMCSNQKFFIPHFNTWNLHTHTFFLRSRMSLCGKLWNLPC